MARQAACTPHGRLTAVFADDAERQGAYKLVEKGHAPAEALVVAAGEAAWGRAEGPFVVVPIDGSTLTLAQASLEKGFGPTGNSLVTALGAESMNAVALSAQGVPLGLVGHVMWGRPATPRPAGTRTAVLPVEEKETRYWLEVAEAVVAGWKASGYKGRPWLQLDAGADAREVLEWMAWGAQGAWVTMRCGQDRKCQWPTPSLLWQVVEALAPKGRYRLKVPPSEKRTGRTAHMVVRFSPVVVQLKCPRTDRLLPVELYAVHAREEGTCPSGEEAVEWLLLTNRPVTCYREARRTLRNYSLRWRVEEVHRSWKTTGCKVEESGLRFEAFSTWAALLLCVAVRIERMKRLSREAPDTPANVEFSPYEVKALLLLKKKGPLYQQGYIPTMGEAVLWLAQLGGYTGKSSGGPPGATTLKRGLDKLVPAAEALQLQEELGRRD
jgi:hypothetical protein